MNQDSPIGYVYILSNPGHRGLLKIGFTTKSVEQRVKELQTAGTPFDFDIAARFRVRDPQKVEHKAHSLLAACRVRKEWFRVSSEEAIEAVREAARGRLVGQLTEEELSVAKEAVTRWHRFLHREMEAVEKLKKEQPSRNVAEELRRLKLRLEIAAKECDAAEEALRELLAGSQPTGLDEIRTISCQACGFEFKVGNATYQVCGSCNGLLMQRCLR